MKYLKNLLLISLLYSQFLYSNTLENFSENSKLLGVSLSPYGDTLTLIAENNFGEEVLYLIDANKFTDNKLTVINSFGAPNLRQDGGYSVTASSICGVTWTGPEDFIFQICGKSTRNEGQIATGIWYKANIQSKKPKKYIDSGFSRERGSLYDPLPLDPDYVLFESGDYQKLNGLWDFESAAVIKVKTNKRNASVQGSTLFRSKKYCYEDCQRTGIFVSAANDPENPVAIIGSSDYDEAQLHLYKKEGDSWEDTPSLVLPTTLKAPFVGEGQKIWYQGSLDGKSDTLLVSNSLDELPEPVNLGNCKNVRNMYFHPDSLDPFSVLTDCGDSFKMVYLDNNSMGARWHKSLVNQFPNSIIRLGWTEDGKRAFVVISSSTNPGDFYLLDTDKKSINYIGSSNQSLDLDLLSKSELFKFTSRDGMEIHGIYSHPKDIEGEVPLIVIPHGGPKGPYDTPRYDPWVHVLNSFGYATLKVNFRSSGGYGDILQDAGDKVWGTKVIDDITDGVIWTISNKSIDKDKICVIGASFGGYATMMSLIREPDLYKCGVPMMGVYDLSIMFTRDRADASRGQSRGIVDYKTNVIGHGDESHMLVHSPLNNANKVKAPVFFIHGAEDKRVPIIHMERMQTALSKLNKPYETLVFEDEGHGWRQEENKLEFYQRLRDFLGKHLDS